MTDADLQKLLRKSPAETVKIYALQGTFIYDTCEHVQIRDASKETRAVDMEVGGRSVTVLLGRDTIVEVRWAVKETE